MTRAEQNRQTAERQLVSQVKDLAIQGYMKLLRSYEAKGYNLTGQLRDSIYVKSKALQQELVYEIEIGFRGYGKYKDLKYMQPGVDIDGLLDYVQKVGIKNFKYIPGLLSDAQRRKPIDKTRAELRIAWGLAMGRKKKGDKQIRRRGKGWYNPTKGRLEYDFMHTINESLQELANDFVITNFTAMDAP